MDHSKITIVLTAAIFVAQLLAGSINCSPTRLQHRATSPNPKRAHQQESIEKVNETTSNRILIGNVEDNTGFDTYDETYNVDDILGNGEKTSTRTKMPVTGTARAATTRRSTKNPRNTKKIAINNSSMMTTQSPTKTMTSPTSTPRDDFDEATIRNNVTAFVQTAQLIMFQAIDPIVSVNSRNTMQRSGPLSLQIRKALNDTEKEQVRRAFNEAYKARPIFNKAIIRRIRGTSTTPSTTSSNNQQLNILGPKSLELDSCDDSIRDGACRLWESHQNGTAFLLPFMPDRLANAENGRASAFMNIFDTCQGRKATTIMGGKVCLDAKMLNALASFSASYFAETLQPLIIKSLASGNASSKVAPSIAHSYGAAVDLVCLAFAESNGSIKNEASLCAKITEFCISKSKELGLPYYPMSFPAEDHGCDRSPDAAISNSVHCTLGIGSIPRWMLEDAEPSSSSPSLLSTQPTQLGPFDVLGTKDLQLIRASSVKSVGSRPLTESNYNDDK